MGKKGDECQPFACQIQACLQKNTYNPDVCQWAVEAMLDCCEKYLSKELPSCDGFKFLLKKRLESREKEKKN